MHAGLALFAVWAWQRYVRRTQGNPVINGGSLLYALLIGEMVAQTLVLAVVEMSYWTLAAGALLFLGSDLVLGNWQVKGNSWTPVNDVVWTLYVSGQLLIVYSVAAVVRVLGTVA
jgi:hypothetical protein